MGGSRGRVRDLLWGAQGLEESVHCAPVLLSLRDLLNLRDPMLLGLEVAGLRQKFPDVRCEDWCWWGDGEEERGGADTHLFGVPIARIMSLPSWTCAGMCPESSAWPHSAPCRPAHSPLSLRVTGHSLASCQYLLLRCPPAFPPGPVPDARLPPEYSHSPWMSELCIGEGG